MPIPMNVQPGSLPAGYCPPSEQARLNAYAALLSVTFPLSATALNYGNTQPVPDQQSYPWIRTNSDGTLDGLYVYSNGNWIRPHPIPANSPILFPYTGTAASIVTYDGGEVTSGGTITSDAGAMWQIATTDGNVPNSTNSNVIAAGQFLLGQNNLANPNGNTYTAGSSGGEEYHILSADENGPHTHTPPAGDQAFIVSGSAFSISGGGASQSQGVGSTGVSGTGGTVTYNGVTYVRGHNNMPSWFSVFYIVRTARQFYRV